jgi:hypothetical protein
MGKPKYLDLKRVYCETINQTVSDATFYRVVKDLKRMRFEVNVKTVKLFAQYRNQIGYNVKNSPEFMAMWMRRDELKEFYGSTTMKCSDFHSQEILPMVTGKGYSIPQSTWYGWYSTCGVPFKASHAYQFVDLSFVKLMAMAWIKSKDHEAQRILEQ